MVDVWCLWTGLNSESTAGCPYGGFTLAVVTVAADLQNTNESCTQSFIKCPSRSMELQSLKCSPVHPIIL